MTVSLPSGLESFVHAEVSGGRYAKPEDVVSEALEMLRNHTELKRSIQEGIDELDRGEFVDGETAFRELRAYAEEIVRRNS